MDPVIEIRTRAGTRRVAVGGTLEIGRDCEGIVIDDPKVSRRHALLMRDNGHLAVVDLGSTNGTTVNGATVSGRRELLPGDVVRIGDVELVPVAPQDVPPPQPATQAHETDDVVVVFTPGSHGAAAAKDVADAVHASRARLARLVPPAGMPKPQIHLIDPYRDASGAVVASGTVVDDGQIWMVVSAESPPEPPGRPLAMLIGSRLPAGADLAVLLEGFGMHASGIDPPDLAGIVLPPIEDAEGELRSAMALSFVRFLIDRDGEDAFVAFLQAAQPGRLDAAASERYGVSLAALEESWRSKLSAGAQVPAGRFVRLTARYLRAHVARQAEIFVYMIAGLGFTMVFPFAFRHLLDSAIPSGRFDKVVGILGVLAVAFMVSLLAGLRRAYLSAFVSSSIIRKLRTEMFERLQVLSPRWFAKRQQGDVLGRLFTDVGVLEQGISETMREGIFQALSLVVSGIVLLRLNLLLGGIVLLGAPLVALVYRAMGSGANKRSVAVQEETGSVMNVASENYGAQPVVKMFGLEARERTRFDRASERLFKAELRMQLFGGLFGLSVNMVVTVLRMVVLGLGAWLIFNGHLTVGGLVAFMSLMGETLSPVTSLTGVGRQIQESSGALVRINEVLDEIPEVRDAPGAVALAPLSREIRFAGVGFSFSPERRTLADLDLVIPAGSKVAFVGPSGAGKSSVLQLIMRFYDADEGAVLFDGRDVREVTLGSLRSQMGVVFQETFLFGTTIRENVALGKPGATDAEVEAACRAAEVHDFVMAMPRGYDTLVGERGGRLSGGQKQRLAIARALIRDPRILLLDEATSALDPKTERLISDTLERVSAGRTTIAVTHRLTSITDYDRIFVIVAGRLAEQGTHDELVAAGGVYATLWAEQTGGAPAAFDARTALAQLPLFAGLGPDDLGLAAGHLRTRDLAPGASIAEGAGLVLIRSGRAAVVAPAPGGDGIVAELGPGDVFGMRALLEGASDARLEAIDAVSALVLEPDAIASLGERLPSVAARLSGDRQGPRPAGGVRLSRMTAMRRPKEVRT